jgi:DUF438 domain-containing protein
MSEIINNRKYRQEQLKIIIERLHAGASVEEVKEEFKKLSRNVTAVEITEMEQALVDEGMPVENIQKLCDVHASIFKGSIEQIHTSEETRAEFEEGHPIHTFRLENRRLEKVLENDIIFNLNNFIEDNNENNKQKLYNGLLKLKEIDNHYKRKENLIFPYMENYEITAPPQVMWGVDDEIRADLKIVLASFDSQLSEFFPEEVRTLVTKVNEMIFKEEEIMFPMIVDLFTVEEWIAIEKATKDFGFSFITAIKRWKTALLDKEELDKKNKTLGTIKLGKSELGKISKDSNSLIDFDAGSLTSKEINAILNTIPIDMTFVGADNKVKYFTQGKERVFDRPLTIIGREVKHCHPPKSVHIVEQIVEDLRTGKKENEDFWIKMGPNFVYIRYFAVRDKEGIFLGTLEVTQNIKPITEIEGEKRLRDSE